MIAIEIIRWRLEIILIRMPTLLKNGLLIRLIIVIRIITI